MADHALLSASGAHRWLECTPSAMLERDVEDVGSVYAREGTLAHLIAETMLRIKLGMGDVADLEKCLAHLKTQDCFDNSMMGYVDVYVDMVLEKYNQAKSVSSDAEIIIEARLNFSKWVPDGFGTGDAVIVCDDCVEIIDLKYGQGKPVYANNNPQLRLYGAGALESYGFMYDANKVVMTIVQPRLDSISSEVLEVSELYVWLDDYVKPRALLASKGEGEFLAGTHCQFCKVKATCKARADKMLSLVSHEFKNPNLLGVDEIASILPIAKSLSSWCSDLENYAFNKLSQGEIVPGWKLVEGRSNRKIIDEAKAIDMLSKEDGGTTNVVKPISIRPLGELEKYFGKKKLESLVGDLIIKPLGNPTLVPESDKRPAINSVENDFKNEEF